MPMESNANVAQACALTRQGELGQALFIFNLIYFIFYYYYTLSANLGPCGLMAHDN